MNKYGWEIRSMNKYGWENFKFLVICIEYSTLIRVELGNFSFKRFLNSLPNVPKDAQSYGKLQK